MLKAELCCMTSLLVMSLQEYYYFMYSPCLYVIYRARRALLQREASELRFRPLSAMALRIRYLTRLGAPLPEHYSSHLSSLAHRSVLK
ncbi:hypothetical protein GDO78_001802 [Eleutherodactylus coqui]|uniref:Uncharacterized protein n=1 Tax=Eleutherodactylus coqui TaxID=57060 RepID=A0A8J6FT14_ELECQ|nr:hypothetical protein GDO78_001802 [Eleutherodactylus coqui]